MQCKNKLKWVIIFVFLLNSLTYAGNEKQTYLDLLRQGAYEQLEKHLTEWEQQSPKDPEMFIAWYNYYINRNLVTGIATSQEKSQYVIGPRQTFNHDDVIKGISYLDSALLLYPNRLDIHIGKITSLEQIGEVQLLGQALIDFLSTSIAFKGKWLDSSHSEITDNSYNALRMVQEKIYGLYRSDDTNALDVINNVSLSMIKYYPEHVFGYNNCGGIAFSRQDYAAALQYFIKGMAIEPYDEYVILNTGICYFKLNQYKEARPYLVKVIASEDPQVRDRAKHYLDEIER